jgi:DNA-binding SARP family transcriptional activator
MPAPGSRDSTTISIETARARGRWPLPGVPDSVSVTLLGGFRLRVGRKDVELVAGAQRLAALLALRGRMSRSRLAGTLWPDTTEQRALASLRTGIWRINTTTPRLVACSAGMVDLDAAVRVDVRELVDRALKLMRDDAPQGGSWNHLPEDDGELLPDWEDEWLVDDRERLRQLRLHVLETLAGRLATEGRFGLALELALAALRSDVLRESAHRSVISVHMAEGNVSEARRAYATCCEVLERELGIAPTAATTSILAPGPGRIDGFRTAVPIPRRETG